MATLIGRSAATCFWVAKIGANQVGRVLRPAGAEKTRRRTFLKCPILAQYQEAFFTTGNV